MWNSFNFRNGLDVFSKYFPCFLSFLAWNPCKILRNKSEKFKLFFSRIFGPSYNHPKTILRWSGEVFFLRSVNYFFRAILAPLKFIYKSFSDGQGNLFLRFFCFADFWPPWKTWKSTLDDPPWKPFPLGPCPDDRAQNSVQDSLNESSIRPNPTLVWFLVSPWVPVQRLQSRQGA